jgi:hypothetical protein
MSHAVAPAVAPAGTAPRDNVDAERPVGPAPQPVRRNSGAIDVTPRGLQLEPLERAYLQELSALVSSPRETKRLVNLYRIIRCSLDDLALERLLDGHYKIVQICLALVVGRPAFSAELFRRILSGELGSEASLSAWLRVAEPTRTVSDQMSCAMLRDLIDRTHEFADWGDVTDAVRRVARFSFETGRVLRGDAIRREPQNV